MSLERTLWRVTALERNEGAYLTAVERALREGVTQGTSPPTLLFTTWAPTVSLGRSQSYALDVDERACQKYGVHIIRRHSGGQAVYLDEGYMVFSAIAPPHALTSNLTRLRKEFCSMMIDALHDHNVPASFREPDNIVIEADNIRTLGNSGQIIHSKAIVAQGSLRYLLGDLDVMLDVLKVNGQKLNEYALEIHKVLADIRSHNDGVSQEDIRNSFLRRFLERAHGRAREGELTYLERGRVKHFLQEEKNVEWVKGRETDKSRGVCYFFVDGYKHNLVPALQLPNSIEDSRA